MSSDQGRTPDFLKHRSTHPKIRQNIVSVIVSVNIEYQNEIPCRRRLCHFGTNGRHGCRLCQTSIDWPQTLAVDCTVVCEHLIGLARCLRQISPQVKSVVATGGARRWPLCLPRRNSQGSNHGSLARKWVIILIDGWAARHAPRMTNYASMCYLLPLRPSIMKIVVFVNAIVSPSVKMFESVNVVSTSWSYLAQACQVSRVWRRRTQPLVVESSHPHGRRSAW